jgi:hypothetical protein
MLYGRFERRAFGVAERVSGGEAAGGDAGREAVRVMLVVGPELRGVQVVAGPFEQAVMAGGNLFGAAFHAADARFARAIVPGHSHRREQRNDATLGKPLLEEVTGECRPIVAFEYQRRTTSSLFGSPSPLLSVIMTRACCGDWKPGTSLPSVTFDKCVSRKLELPPMPGIEMPGNSSWSRPLLRCTVPR